MLQVAAAKVSLPVTCVTWPAQILLPYDAPGKSRLLFLASRAPTLSTCTWTQPDSECTLRVTDSGTPAVPVAGASLADTMLSLTVACNGVDPAAALLVRLLAPAVCG